MSETTQQPKETLTKSGEGKWKFLNKGVDFMKRLNASRKKPSSKESKVNVPTGVQNQTSEMEQEITRLANDLAMDESAVIPTEEAIFTNNAQKHQSLTDEQKKTLLEENKRVREKLAQEVQYPIYALDIEKLKSLEKLVSHEEALEKGLLSLIEPGQPGTYNVFDCDAKGAKCVVQNGESSKAWAYTDNMVVFSHRWLRPHLDPNFAHPDDEENTKLLAMKHIFSGDIAKQLWPDMQEFERPKYLWFDYLCVPQFNRELQQKAIQSIPAYFYQSCKFVALIEQKAKLDTYLSRSWCRLEVISARAPRPWAGAYYVPSQQRFFYMNDKTIEDVTWEHFLNPLVGELTREADAIYIKTLLEYFVEALTKFKDMQPWQIYAQAGEKEWLHPEDIPDSVLDMLHKAVESGLSIKTE